MKTPILAITIALLFTSCGGEKRGQVIERLKPKFDTLRAELGELAKIIPTNIPPANSKPGSSDLAPKPTFKNGDPAGSNTVILMLENLTDPESDPTLRLYLDNDLLAHFAWTGENSPLSESAAKGKVGSEFEAELQASLDLRYIAVAQVLSYQPAIATSDTQFRPGSAHLGGYLIDRETQKVICSFALKAHTDDKVDFVYRESGRSKQEALEAWANSTIYENAREQFLKKLAGLTGGNFG